MLNALKKLLRLKVNVWVTIPLLLFSWFWVTTLQTRGIAKAQRHVNEITPKWQMFQQENPRFRGVKFGAGTAQNGCIIVKGFALNEQDYERAVQFIENTDPPRPVEKWLRVMPDEATFNEMFPLNDKNREKQDKDDEKKSD